MSSPAERLRHRRAPRPIFFPVGETVPENKRHLKLRTALFVILEREIGGHASIGSDQFVYWNARDPRRCLTPDVFVKLGVPDHVFPTWKSWEKSGPPDLAIEIVSPSDWQMFVWNEKLERYHELGVRELIRFNPDGEAGECIQVWDRIEEDLVERVVDGDVAECVTLGLHWVVAPVTNLPAGLRLARDACGRELVPTPEEAEARGRAAAERRVVELEAELARRR